MKDWIELLSKLSLTVAALLAVIGVVWFLYKQVWPMFKAQIEEANKQRQEESERRAKEIERFLESLRHLDQTADARAREHLQALTEISKALHALREEILHQGIGSAPRRK